MDILLTEYKQSGVMPNGFYDMAFNEETRRMIWAGQSPDGRKWDENMPEGQPAKPWNGCSDTKVPGVDAIVNDDVAMLTAAFRKAEFRASTVNPDNLPLVSSINDYLHWLVNTKHKAGFRLEAELAAQYSREYAFAIAYIGWERELGKRKMDFTMQQLEQMAQTIPDFSDVPAMVMDPTQESAAAEAMRSLYRFYVVQTMQGKGFYEQELEDEAILDLPLPKARKMVRDLREDGETDVPLPYVCKNQALVRVCKPFQEVFAARGTMMLQQARAIFWRRWMTEAELESKRADGWDPDWIDAVKATKGNISSWAGALGATSLTGPSTKTVGNTTYLKITEENNPLIEVVYAYVKKVDEDGVTGVWETIFSPHVTKTPETGADAHDFCASHTLLDYAHGQYPFVEFKRENLGRALTDTRSVAEIAATWQNEEKEQRDMLFNRSQLDTLPPLQVPKLGGVDYKLGPGAQLPTGRGQDLKFLNLGAPQPTLALELVQMLRLTRDDYFGQFNEAVHPAKLGVKQEKSADDYYTFWGQVLVQVLALTVQYNPQEIVAVTSNPALANLDPFDVVEQVQVGLEFDIRDLNPDYMMTKLETIITKLLAVDVTGVVDRGALVEYIARAIDPRLAQRFILDKRSASQKVFDDVQKNVANAMLGFEPAYTDASNDATAPMKLQFLQQLMQTNPKCQQLMQGDERFRALLENYAKNLQMGMMQQQNKQIGRIGVQPVGPGK